MNNNFINKYIKFVGKECKNNPDEMIKKDVVYIPEYKTAFTRGEYKTFKRFDMSKLVKKELNTNGFINPDFLINDPLNGFKQLSNIQKKINEMIPMLDKFGSMLFTASCGAGKTRAALKIVFETKCKTLIISARNAVNDQWLSEIKLLYPKLNIKQKFNQECDVLILTPQYILKNYDKIIDLNVNLIIYDEIHSLLAQSFSKVLSLPYELVMNGKIHNLPYMIGLTATLPNSSSEEYANLLRIFGKEYNTSDDIRNIPVEYTDYRNYVLKRGEFDQNYDVPDDRDVFEYYLDKIMNSNEDEQIKPSNKFKLIVITHTINDSIYCACRAAFQLNLNVLLIRAVSESSYVITPESLPENYRESDGFDDEDLPKYTLDDFKFDNFAKEVKNYQKELNNVAIIVGTDARLKEGFNCGNIVTGICTSFLWSTIARIQILGRIRRNNIDVEINNHRRLFMVCSGRIPSNLTDPRRHKFHLPIKLNYDLEYEKKMFEIENYKCIDNVQESNTTDLKHKSNTTDLKHKSNTTDLNTTDLKHKSNTKKSNTTDLKHKSNTTDLKHKSNTTDLKHKSNTTDLKHKSNTTDLKQNVNHKSNTTDLKPLNTLTTSTQDDIVLKELKSLLDM